MMLNFSTQCSCGAGLAVPIFAHSLIRAFTQLHEHCIAQSRDDANEEPGGDVFTHVVIAQPHSEPELQTGFQRQWL
jgi:hypothetical protein